MELNPGSALVHDTYGIYYASAQGRHEEAISHLKRAHELDPLSLWIGTDLGWAYYHARRFDEAIPPCKSVLDLDGGFVYALWCIGLANAARGWYDEALAALERGVDLAGDDTALRADLGLIYGLAGRQDKAREVLNSLNGRASSQFVSPLSFAMAYIGVDDKDQAFRWLQRAAEDRSTWIIFLKEHARYDRLRSDPRFAALLHEIGLEK